MGCSKSLKQTENLNFKFVTKLHPKSTASDLVIICLSLILLFDENKIKMARKEAREETEGKSGMVNRGR